MPSWAQDAKASEKHNQQLNDVKRAIAKQKLAISNVSKKRQQLENQLKKDDLAIAAVAKSINNTEKKLIVVQQKLIELTKQKQQLTKEKQKQEALLAKQLKAAYASGHHDYLKLILNQEQPANVQRTVTYYDYLNKARIEHIDEFQHTLTALLEVTTQHQEQEQQLNELKQQQAAEQQTLKSNKTARSQTIASLQKELLTSKQQLAKLEAEENNLVAALAKLAAAARAEIDLKGLAKLRNKLRWPVNGKMRHRFGTKKQGYLKWKGVLIGANVGSQVKTIHNGTVLFSDWLKGYGLVTVIDHGNGYMSLYGHNQALLKKVGDRVETGEPIALVGQSGGQQSSGLYFEIRHQGKAVNPRLWCK
ncbi:murein hydrolase activator EnvC family protein [Thalassotalea sp. PLHSN55]|uniref:murein hydrolase activator EnvC family protein n=1 Tax=Thalassotalea sp. PLHSN55 TaxID=3435888 RepID=UPI003F827AF1